MTLIHQGIDRILGKLGSLYLVKLRCSCKIKLKSHHSTRCRYLWTGQQSECVVLLSILHPQTEASATSEEANLC